MVTKEKRKEYDKTYRERHKEKEIARHKLYYDLNKDKILARQQQWSQTENGKLLRKAKKLRRKAKIRNQLGQNPPTADQLKEMLANPCAYCGGVSEHIDHIIPLSRGGLHDVSNVTGACVPCNLEKGSKLLSEWQR